MPRRLHSFLWSALLLCLIPASVTAQDDSARPAGPARALQDLQTVYAECLPMSGGKVADYIPALAKADPGNFGLAVATADGRLLSVGEADAPFTIQSVSKVFTLALALKDRGLDAVAENVGFFPTGFAFNSVVSPEVRPTRLQNPFVNAGAITTMGLVQGRDSADAFRRVHGFFNRLAGRKLPVNHEVFRSENATGDRNRALAYLSKSYGFLDGDVLEVCQLYFKTCSLQVTAIDLARMGATLANGGESPFSGERLIAPEHVRPILSAMLMAGMYDASGPWLMKVGLPAKSGVGGGIIAVVPGRMCIAAFSPPLDESGNSVRGVAAIARLARKWDLHLFGQ